MPLPGPDPNLTVLTSDLGTLCKTVEVDFSDLEFQEILGRGSAGSVYRVLWKSKEKVVALKKLNLLESSSQVSLVLRTPGKV